MKFLNLILKNAFRNRRRTILTMLSIGMSLFLISTLFTLLNELENPPLSPAAALRVIVRHKVSVGVLLPIFHREKIRRISGVEHISAMEWFGGVYQDPGNFFAQFAVDPEEYLNAYPDIQIAPEQREAFVTERSAALAGVQLAQRYGWKIGDRVTLKGTIFPFDVETVIRGLISGAKSENNFYFRWDYFNELSQNQSVAGMFVVKVRSPEQVPSVIDAIDGMFANSPAPTRTETVKAFLLEFGSMWGNVRTLVIGISTVVLFTIVLVAANTMAMSVRERTGEIAILKALGFRRAHVVTLALAEASFIALAGGLAGSLAARWVFALIDFSRFTTGLIQRLDVRWSTIGMALALSLLVAFISTLIPAWNASRRVIADAVRRRGE